MPSPRPSGGIPLPGVPRGLLRMVAELPESDAGRRRGVRPVRIPHCGAGLGAVQRLAGEAGGRLWPNPSSGCTRPNSSVIPAKAGTGAARGVTARQSSSPPSNGCTGTTTGACSDPSTMCLRLHSRHTAPINCMSRRWPPDSSKSPSGKPGAIHSHSRTSDGVRSAPNRLRRFSRRGSCADSPRPRASCSNCSNDGYFNENVAGIVRPTSARLAPRPSTPPFPAACKG